MSIHGRIGQMGSIQHLWGNRHSAELLENFTPKYPWVSTFQILFNNSAIYIFGKRLILSVFIFDERREFQSSFKELFGHEQEPLWWPLDELSRRPVSSTGRNAAKIKCQKNWWKSVYINDLTRWFPSVSYALVPAGAKLELFGLWEQIAQIILVLECFG